MPHDTDESKAVMADAPDLTGMAPADAPFAPADSRADQLPTSRRPNQAVSAPWRGPRG
jgi:hypothetical protein